jgi:hypothetical protein
MIPMEHCRTVLKWGQSRLFEGKWGLAQQEIRTICSESSAMLRRWRDFNVEEDNLPNSKTLMRKYQVMLGNFLAFSCD